MCGRVRTRLCRTVWTLLPAKCLSRAMPLLHITPDMSLYMIAPATYDRCPKLTYVHNYSAALKSFVQSLDRGWEGAFLGGP